MANISHLNETVCSLKQCNFEHFKLLKAVFESGIQWDKIYDIRDLSHTDIFNNTKSYTPEDEDIAIKIKTSLDNFILTYEIVRWIRIKDEHNKHYKDHINKPEFLIPKPLVYN